MPGIEYYDLSLGSDFHEQYNHGKQNQSGNPLNDLKWPDISVVRMYIIPCRLPLIQTSHRRGMTSHWV